MGDSPDQDGLTAYAYRSRRIGDRTWRVSVQNADELNAHSVTAFAYCVRHGPNPDRQRRQGDLPVSQTVTMTPRCPKGSMVFSGGNETPDGHGVYATPRWRRRTRRGVFAAP